MIKYQTGIMSHNTKTRQKKLLHYTCSLTHTRARTHTRLYSVDFSGLSKKCEALLL